jgi:hypothetical protein
MRVSKGGGKLLADNDHNRKQTSTREVDRFSRFMFGGLKPRGTTHSQENSDTRSNHTNDWFLGRSRKEPVSSNKDKDQQTQTTQNKVENFINNVDIDLLFETYDTIVTTTEQYKPLLKGIAPFFSKITSKFKK